MKLAQLSEVGFLKNSQQLGPGSQILGSRTQDLESARNMHNIIPY